MILRYTHLVEDKCINPSPLSGSVILLSNLSKVVSEPFGPVIFKSPDLTEKFKFKNIQHYLIYRIYLHLLSCKPYIDINIDYEPSTHLQSHHLKY